VKLTVSYWIEYAQQQLVQSQFGYISIHDWMYKEVERINRTGAKENPPRKAEVIKRDARMWVIVDKVGVSGGRVVSYDPVRGVYHAQTV